MKKFLRILVDVTWDLFYKFVDFICNNMMNFANILNLLLPFVMYFIGKQEFSFDVWILFPIVPMLLIYYAREIANKIGKGITIPIPGKRFTEIDDEGEVSVEHSRLQELLLYVADLEDWLERKGML